jgi:hypothetical protein
MFSPYEIQYTKMDLIFFTTRLIINQLLTSQILGLPLFTLEWFQFLLATIFGVILHGLVTMKITSIINNTLNFKTKKYMDSVSDIMRFGTIFVCQRILTSYMSGTEVIFDFIWILQSILAMLSLIIFNIFENGLLSQNNILYDMSNFTFAFISLNIPLYNSLSIINFLDLVGINLGIIVYHLLTKNLIPN